jgi:hypothetical protein
VTTPEAVFLNYQLVTVEWKVTETTIRDRYEIVLQATYETDVPAAVVVADPGSVTLPDMKAGDVFTGEFTLTNHGLIRASEKTVFANGPYRIVKTADGWRWEGPLKYRCLGVGENARYG